MKKIIRLLIIVILLCNVVGCAKVETIHDTNNKSGNVSMFIEIETAEYWKVVYHRETKVMYYISNGYYNCGTMTPLLNPDGTPMTYEEK